MPIRLRARLGEVWSLVAHSLSGRLLLLTVLFVLTSEVVIFAPSVGLYYRDLLHDHVLSAELAIFPFTEPGGQSLPWGLRVEMLKRANADAVLLKRADQREFYQSGAMPSRIDRVIDLKGDTLIADMVNGLDCLVSGGARELSVVAPTHIRNAQEIGIVLPEAPIRNALVVYAWRVVATAVFISWLTAALVFASLYFLLVRPMRRITHAMAVFREDPEDESRILNATRRAGEIGQAERELAAMQRDLYGFLHQKARLAALGAAVARIQHDLRNILATAQLASDRLAASEDPAVKRLTPSLVAAIDRAVGLATNTLKFVRSGDQPPQRVKLALKALIDEAAASALLPGAAMPIAFDNRVAPDLEVDADREQLFRVVLNLILNAVQTLSRREDGAITVTAAREFQTVEIDIADNGSGISETIRDKLFQPFAPASQGGSGLGLAIARELVRGHGGELSLISTGPEGTVFRISLPN